MKNLCLALLSLAAAFTACKEQKPDFSDKEKAKILSSKAYKLFWGPDNGMKLDTLPDITPVLEKIDSAIALDPENWRYYYQKADYLNTVEDVEALSKVFRQLIALGEDKSSFIPNTLGMCFARQGETDSAKHYYRKAIELLRKERTPGLAPAFVDSAYIAHLECYITGDREAAIRKIEESADTTRLSESEKTRLRQILEDFDLNQLIWQPCAEEIERTKNLLKGPRRPLAGVQSCERNRHAPTE